MGVPVAYTIPCYPPVVVVAGTRRTRSPITSPRSSADDLRSLQPSAAMHQYQYSNQTRKQTIHPKLNVERFERPELKGVLKTLSVPFDP